MRRLPVVDSPPLVSSKPVVLYDGRCRLCSAGAERIRSHDTEHALEVLSLHEPAVAARFPNIKQKDVLAEMHFVRPDGSIAKGHEAVREVLRVIPSYRWLSLFWMLPGFQFVADKAYKWVAANRYRFNKVRCENDYCSMH
jgi:predicted DCC family thiol-disulfide oxidoreductase YuxK